LSEADRIVVFFTREFGVVRGVAKGAKRLNSKFGSTLEPFSTVNLTYFQKEERELVSIQQVELTQSRFDVASDPVFLNTFSYIADLLTDFAPPHDADETLYRMITACMEAAEKDGDLSAIRLYFELWLLRLSGYLPDWSKCENCERQLADDESARLVSGFHLQCVNCKKGYVIGEIGSGDRDVFHKVQKLSPVDFIEYTATQAESIAVLSSALKRIIAQVLGREVAGGGALR
jgi:DNA repair protein RecO (recombination protein O)